jgi:hypothetical protein
MNPLAGVDSVDMGKPVNDIPIIKSTSGITVPGDGQDGYLIMI